MIGDFAITIRSYKEDDLDEVISVFLGSIRQIAIRNYDEAQIEAWAQADRSEWKLRLLSKPTWVALKDEKVIGFSALEPNGHLDMMYVHPAYQRLGVASALLSAIEAVVRLRGFSDISVDSSLTARPFFEKRGFKATQEQQVLVHGQVLCNFRMFKSLC